MSDILFLLLIFAIIYIFFIVCWAVLCFVAYGLSVLTRKNVFINIVLGLNLVAMWLMSGLIGLVLLWNAFSLLFQGQVLWFFFWIFFGFSIVFAITNYLQTPFILITAYFTLKAGELNKRFTST